jgi:hypothetical protein
MDWEAMNRQERMNPLLPMGASVLIYSGRFVKDFMITNA